VYHTGTEQGGEETNSKFFVYGWRIDSPFFSLKELIQALGMFFNSHNVIERYQIIGRKIFS